MRKKVVHEGKKLKAGNANDGFFYGKAKEKEKKKPKENLGRIEKREKVKEEGRKKRKERTQREKKLSGRTSLLSLSFGERVERRKKWFLTTTMAE